MIEKYDEQDGKPTLNITLSLEDFANSQLFTAIERKGKAATPFELELVKRYRNALEEIKRLRAEPKEKSLWSPRRDYCF